MAELEQALQNAKKYESLARERVDELEEITEKARNELAERLSKRLKIQMELEINKRVEVKT
jgi:hypothetical protein